MLMPVKKRERQRADVGKERFANVVNDALPNGRHKKRLQKFHQPVAHIQPCQAAQNPCDRVALADRGHSRSCRIGRKNGSARSQCGQEQNPPESAALPTRKLPKARQRTLHVFGFYHHAAASWPGNSREIGGRRHSFLFSHFPRLQSASGRSPGKFRKMPAIPRACQSPAARRCPDIGCGRRASQWKRAG